MNQYIFILGREYKLSIAEIGHVFGWDSLKVFDRDMALIETEDLLDNNTLHLLGGTIRIIKVQEARMNFREFIESKIHQIPHDKINIALSAYGVDIDRKSIASSLKNSLKKSGKNIRYIGENTKNINAGSYKKNRLGKYQTEYNSIVLDGKDFFGTTIACQDVDAYARRDIAKIRDMQVGMMPPKLVQIMINIATHNGEKNISRKEFTSVNDGEQNSSDKDIRRVGQQNKLLRDKNIEEGNFSRKEFTSVNKGEQNFSDKDNRRVGAIYDPFCGLGTTLIEAIDAGLSEVHGSDKSAEMVANSKRSVESFVAEEQKWQSKIREKGGTPRHDIRNLVWSVDRVNAENIDEANIWNIHNSRDIAIISEGFLGDIVTKSNFSQEKIQGIRRKLKTLYASFFGGLRNIDFDGTIIMSFPFWKKGETCIYFREIYEIIRENSFEIVPMIPEEYNLNTKENTLLYARKSHLVGREIILIQRKVQ